MSEPYFLICPNLKVYNDFGYSQSPGEMYTAPSITKCECNRFMFGLHCNNRGKCVLAMEHDSWKIASKKSWGAEK